MATAETVALILGPSFVPLFEHRGQGLVQGPDPASPVADDGADGVSVLGDPFQTDCGFPLRQRFPAPSGFVQGLGGAGAVGQPVAEGGAGECHGAVAETAGYEAKDIVR